MPDRERMTLARLAGIEAKLSGPTDAITAAVTLATAFPSLAAALRKAWKQIVCHQRVGVVAIQERDAAISERDEARAQYAEVRDALRDTVHQRDKAEGLLAQATPFLLLSDGPAEGIHGEIVTYLAKRKEEEDHA